MKRLFVFLCLLVSVPVFADVAVDEAQLADPLAEARARAIMADIRCLVCQNQSIEDSNAELAGDLRRIIRERVALGEDDAAVKSWLVTRYGDWILMETPVNARTLWIWLLPGVLLLVGGTIAFVVVKRGGRLDGPAPLTDAEKTELDALLTGQDMGDKSS